MAVRQRLKLGLDFRYCTVSVYLYDSVALPGDKYK